MPKPPIEEEVEEPPLLRLRVTQGEETTAFSFRVSHLAATRDGLLYLLGITGSQNALKGARAWLNAKVPAACELERCLVEQGPKSAHARSVHPNEEQYHVHVVPLGFGWYHALFVSRHDGFLASVGDAAIFRALKSASFTTPLLRAWTGHVAERLTASGKLQRLWCHGCDCGLITAETGDIDRIVEEGIRGGSLPFRELTIVGG